MRNHHRFPQTSFVIGVLRDPVEHGLTTGSGAKVSATLVNPCDENPNFDLEIPLFAFGKHAADMRRYADGVTIVSCRARISTSQRRLILIVEELSPVHPALYPAPLADLSEVPRG